MKIPIKENKVGHLLNDCDQTLPNVIDDIKPLKRCKISENMHEIQVGIEENLQRSKKLSEIPKNSKWASSYVHQKGVNYFCKFCGRKFKSPRAVFGHLRSHTKRKVEVVSEEVKGVNIPRKKRSFGRYKIHNYSSNNSSWSMNNVSFSDNNFVDYDDEMQEVVASLLFLANGGSGNIGSYSSVDPVSDDNDDDHSVNIVHNSDAQVPKECVNFEGLGKGCDSCEEKIGEFHGCNCEFSKNKDETLNCAPVSYIEFLPELPDAKIKKGDVGVLGNMISCTPASRGTNYETMGVIDQVSDISKSGTCGLTLMTNRYDIEIEVAENVDHRVGLYDSVGSYNGTTETFQEDRMGENLSLRWSGFVIEETKNGSVDVTDQVFDSSTGTSAPTIGNSYVVNESQKYICNICDKAFLTKQALVGHRLHCPSAAKKKTWEFKCDVCCRTFPSGRALGGHKRAHFKRNVQPCNMVDEIAYEKETMVAVKEKRNVENAASGDDIFQAVVTEETRVESEPCCGEIQQLFNERDIVFMSPESISLLV